MKHWILMLAALVLLGGCSSGPRRRDIEAQLDKYSIFADPETWYVCLGSVYNDALYEQVYLPTPSEGCRFLKWSVAGSIPTQGSTV